MLRAIMLIDICNVSICKIIKKKIAHMLTGTVGK